MDAHLTELVTRIENALGPDRALDYDILCIVDPRAIATGLLPGDPKFTASLDAATTLIKGELSGMEFSADETGCWGCVISTHLADSEGFGMSPALALCAASLKAMETPNG